MIVGDQGIYVRSSRKTIQDLKDMHTGANPGLKPFWFIKGGYPLKALPSHWVVPPINKPRIYMDLYS